MEKIKAYIVSGFLGAGKTTFIKDFITGDFFHKKENGKSLVFVFEEGETEYDRDLLKQFRTDVAVWEKGDIKEFILENIKKYTPGRVFAETNVFREGLTDILYEELDVAGNTMLIDASSLEMYYRNMTELLSVMIRKADPVMINRADTKEELNIYSTPFRLMNPQAGFLWETPYGYHEKVFGNAVPFDKTACHIILEKTDYPAWYLDGLENPGDYHGKIIEADLQVSVNAVDGKKYYKAGRTVMTCCINDMTFLGFRLESGQHLKDKCFYHIKAKAFAQETGAAGSKELVLRELGIGPAFET